MTDETFPHEIWADLDHWIEGPAASDLRTQGYMEYIRKDVSDALLKAERKAGKLEGLREAQSMITMRIVQAAGGGENMLSPSDIYQGIEALIEKDATDG